MKIVSTFAAVMTKYMLCILLGTFLMLGIHSVPSNSAQETRIETGAATDVQYFSEPNHCDPQAVMQQSLSRTFPPLKILKFSPTSLIIRILSAFNPQLPDKDWINLSFDTNLTRNSNRYYIFTLERMLI